MRRKAGEAEGPGYPGVPSLGPPRDLPARQEPRISSFSASCTQPALDLIACFVLLLLTFHFHVSFFSISLFLSEPFSPNRFLFEFVSLFVSLHFGFFLSFNLCLSISLLFFEFPSTVLALSESPSFRVPFSLFKYFPLSESLPFQSLSFRVSRFLSLFLFESSS